MGRNGIRTIFWTACIAAVLCGVSCENRLSSIVQADVDAYNAAINQGPPLVDSFVITSGAITYTGGITYTLTSQTPGNGAASITSWQVNENAAAPAASDAGWNSFTSPLNGTYTLSSPGSYGTRTIYAWLKNDRGLVSAPGTQSIQYAAFGGPVINSFTGSSITYDRSVSFTIGATQAGAGATSITDYLVNESSAAPLPGDGGWQAFTSPASGSYTLNPGSFGPRAVYAWLKNDKNLVSPSANISVTYSDYGVPSIDTFVRTSADPTDNPEISINLDTTNYGAGCTSIAGWLVNESATPPSAGDISGGLAPTTFTVSRTAGAHMVYAWARNNHDKVNTALKSISVTINTPAASTAAPPTLTCHDKVVITFTKAMDTTVIPTPTGTMGSEADPPVWTNATTLTISRSTTWSPGSGRTLTVTGCRTASPYLIPCPAFNASFTLFEGVCVSDVSGVDTNDGSAGFPVKKIQVGVTKANSKYGADSEVHVAAGTTYQTNYNSGDFVQMVDRISLYGGYGADWTTRTQYGSTVSDNSGNNGTTNRVINCGAGITAATVIDGFTVQAGSATASVGNYAAAIYCGGSSGSPSAPTLQNNHVIGGSNTTDISCYGVYCDAYSAPLIKNNWIQGGGGNAVRSSAAIYCNGPTTSPTIKWNVVAGGTTSQTGTASPNSTGIYLGLTSNGSSTPVLLIDANDITGGVSGLCSALIARQAGDRVKIRNNVLVAGSADFESYALLVWGGPLGEIRNNTLRFGTSIDMSSRTYAGIRIKLGGTIPHPNIDNNILAKKEGYAGLKYYAVYTDDDTCWPATIQNNDFICYADSSYFYVFRHGATEDQAVSNMEARDSTNFKNNKSDDPKFSNFDSGIYTLTAASPSTVTDGGINGTTPWGFSNDRTPTGSRPSTGAWSMGAYEY